jgi:membrane protein DedA with SNARE-associated domain
MAPLLAAAGTTASAGGLPALLGGVLLVESGVPIPVPADLLVIVVGERASAGAIPLWLAVIVLELIAIIGTTLLFLAIRGPARTVLARVARHLPLPASRLDKATERIQQGRSAVVVGRTTPGLRTLTVVAAALSRMRGAVALPLLVAGSTVFLQGHLALGYALGPVADSILARARVALVLIAVLLVVTAAAVWLLRRGRREGEVGFAEAACPACIALAALAGGLRPAAEPSAAVESVRSA